MNLTQAHGHLYILLASGLSVYSLLAPNTYSQLSTEVAHSPETHTVVSSVVYDVRAYISVYMLVWS